MKASFVCMYLSRSLYVLMAKCMHEHECLLHSNITCQLIVRPLALSIQWSLLSWSSPQEMETIADTNTRDRPRLGLCRAILPNQNVCCCSNLQRLDSFTTSNHPYLYEISTWPSLSSETSTKQCIHQISVTYPLHGLSLALQGLLDSHPPPGHK